jgi:hypothetical protein
MRDYAITGYSRSLRALNKKFYFSKYIEPDMLLISPTDKKLSEKRLI